MSNQTGLNFLSWALKTARRLRDFFWRAAVFSLLFFSFCFLGVFLYAFWTYPSEKKLSQRTEHLSRIYPKKLLLQLGAHMHPAMRPTHFLTYSPAKKSRVVRIGTFGDSHTFGDEVEGKASRPFHLQRLLDKALAGRGKAEILNFGQPGHSFQQQFFLWRYYAKSCGLDYFIYGPHGLHPERDLGFRRPKNRMKHFFRFPKNRFVLSDKTGGEIKEVSVPGRLLADRYKKYYSLFPSLAALRFDKRPFQLWEAVLPFLRRKLSNPFYYSDLPDNEEASKIDRILWKKIQEVHGGKTLLFIDQENLVSDYENIKNMHNLNVKLTSFLYHKFGHPSSLANELIAQIQFNALRGTDKKFSVNVISCRYEKAENPPPRLREDLHLDRVIKIFTGTEDQKTGEIRLNAFDHYWRKEEEASFNGPSQDKGTKSLIGFSGRFPDGIGLSPFFPLPFELKGGETVSLKISKGFFKHETVVLGKVSRLDSGKFFVFYSDWTKIWFKYRHVNDKKSVFVTERLPFKEKLKGASKIQLLIDGRVLGRLSRVNIGKNGEEALALNLHERKRRSFLMTGPARFLTESRLPDRFPLFIHYETREGVLKSRILDWICHKEKRARQLSLPDFEPLPFF